MCCPLTTRVTVRVVPFERWRFGLSEDVAGEGLPTGAVLGVGNGVAHPLSEGQSRAMTMTLLIVK